MALWSVTYFMNGALVFSGVLSNFSESRSKVTRQLSFPVSFEAPSDKLLSLKMNSKLLKFLKVVFLIAFIAIVITLTLPNISSSIKFKSDTNNLEDILSWNIDSKNNIFFFETSGLVKGGFGTKAGLKNRQACSVESAARMNPDVNIFMVFVLRQKLEKSNAIKALKNYKNVVFLQMDLSEFFKDTSVEVWMTNGDFFYSAFLIEHLSDLLRLLALWRWVWCSTRYLWNEPMKFNYSRYGGTYFDLDVISQTSVESIGEENFACAQHENLTRDDAFASGIWKAVSPSGLDLIKTCITWVSMTHEDFIEKSETFSESSWKISMVPTGDQMVQSCWHEFTKIVAIQTKKFKMCPWNVQTLRCFRRKNATMFHGSYGRCSLTNRHPTKSWKWWKILTSFIPGTMQHGAQKSWQIHPLHSFK